MSSTLWDWGRLDNDDIVIDRGGFGLLGSAASNADSSLSRSEANLLRSAWVNTGPCSSEFRQEFTRRRRS